jgi:hypothetical protein
MKGSSRHSAPTQILCPDDAHQAAFGPLHPYTLWVPKSRCSLARGSPPANRPPVPLRVGMQWVRRDPAPYGTRFPSLQGTRPSLCSGSLRSLGEPLKLLHWTIDEPIRRMRLIFSCLYSHSTLVSPIGPGCEAKRARWSASTEPLAGPASGPPGWSTAVTCTRVDRRGDFPATSFRLDPQGLDDRPPFLDIGFY